MEVVPNRPLDTNFHPISTLHYNFGTCLTYTYCIKQLVHNILIFVQPNDNSGHETVMLSNC
ncbi:hypothetical protein HanIR_Chr15g0768511 [Helianthus annuus]|nr:hypothetical protein HanIR_Chr15g0768511 [Helianthus annuus]